MLTEATTAPPPSLKTIAHLLEQSIDEQQETRERLTLHICIAEERLAALDRRLDAMRHERNAQFLALGGQIAQLNRRLTRIEKHLADCVADLQQRETQAARTGVEEQHLIRMEG